MTLLHFLDYAAVAVFAVTGALAASRSQLDVVGFIFIACLTAVGGGTIRDTILDRDVFWVADPVNLAVASTVAILVFLSAHLLESRYRALLWIDALALSAAVPAGVAVALADGQGWPIVIVMGMITGCMGGLLRDVVCNEVPLVLKQGELYVTCAFAGAIAAVVAGLAGVEPGISLGLCALTVLILRAGSLAFGWRLPVYRSEPPKPGSPKR
ncbi:trimeric intracellular cation channel family protein [Tabrizicola sp. BL-A-41-H6]|uniref:trimeric intracellular cation channel family protein n=1 Tax=Tabrizicola sp. BL-A-41-H6 TaxID=3421107 RepID=UPI003D66715C